MNKKDRFNKIMKDLVEFYREDVEKLVKFLIKEKYSYEDIAQVLGVSKQAIHNKYK